MSKISTGILSVMAGALTLGAVQFASGRDLAGMPQPLAEAEMNAGSGINRAAKADRSVAVTGASAAPTRTIALRLDGLSAMSVLLRVPVAEQSRKDHLAPSMTKSGDQKATVACEPVVSVLTAVAKQLQPGRCVT